MSNENEQQMAQVAPEITDASTSINASGSDSDAAEIAAGLEEAEKALTPADPTPAPEGEQAAEGQEGEVKVDPPADGSQPPLDPAAPPAAPAQLPPPQEEAPEPKNLSPQNKANWRALRETTEALKAERSQLMAKLQEIEQARNTLPEEVSKELAELRQLRAMVDIKNDPEFQKQYVEALNTNETEIYKMLEDFGMPKEQIEAIKAAGGTEKISTEAWQENVLSKLGDLDRMALAQKLLKTKEIKSGAERAASLAASNWEKHQQQQQIQQQEFQKTYSETEQGVIQEFLKAIPDAQFKQVPANATPQQKAEIEAHNAKFKEYLDRDAQMIEGMKRGDPTITTQMRLAANYSFYLRDMNAQLQESLKAKDAQIAALEGKVNGIKAAGTTSRQAAAAPAVKASKRTTDDLLAMKDEDAIALGLDAAMGR